MGTDFGLAILEYMACNKPIIATKVGGINDLIVNNKNGFLVEVEDYKTLADKIIYMLDHPEIANQFVQYNNELIIKNYSIENVISKHIDLFNKLAMNS